MSATRTQLLSAATTGTGTAVADCSGMVWLKAYLKGTGTISAGSIVIEEADYFGSIPPTAPTTWSTVATIAATDVSDGTQKAYVLTIAPYSYVRARFASAITGGGSVDLELVAVGP